MNGLTQYQTIWTGLDRPVAAFAIALACVGCGGGNSSPVCQDVFLDVQAGNIYGQFCQPAGGKASVLQVLVHGATYSHSYWNFPGFDGKYSYSAYMNRAGYATLAIDQLGVGRSSHPPSQDVTFQAASQALHQVLGAVRGGALGATYGKVVLVAHSIGSLVSLDQTVRQGGVDGLLLSGFSHSLGSAGFGKLTANVVPALNDPLVAGRIPAGDFGYLSVVGGRNVFYETGDADPALVRADENGRSEMSGFLNPADYLLADSNRITLPVLIANGSRDIAFCAQGGGGSTTDCKDAAALLASERPYFASAGPLEAYVLNDAGHNLNLTLQSNAWYASALAWFQRYFPA